MAENKTPEQYVDEKGRPYSVEHKVCCAAVLGRTGEQKIHIVYEDGSKAIILGSIHATHSKLEQVAQRQPKCTDYGAEGVRDIPFPPSPD